MFIESTDTLMAYNPARLDYNLPNYYGGSILPRGARIFPKNTPLFYSFGDKDSISCGEHLLKADIVHKNNLTTLGIPFRTVSDEYLDQPLDRESTDIIIFGSHNEYWTSLKAQHVMEFVDNGGKVLFLGGNTAWRQVFRGEDRTWIHGNGLLENKIFKKLITEYLGTYYTDSGYNTYAPLKIVDNAIANRRFSLDVEKGDEVGANTIPADCHVVVEGISGHETDKLHPENKGFSLIARGLNSNNGGSDVVYKLFPSGGEVLNFSSVALWLNQDERIKRMIANFLVK